MTRPLWPHSRLDVADRHLVLGPIPSRPPGNPLEQPSNGTGGDAVIIRRRCGGGGACRRAPVSVLPPSTIIQCALHREGLARAGLWGGGKGKKRNVAEKSVSERTGARETGIGKARNRRSLPTKTSRLGPAVLFTWPYAKTVAWTPERTASTSASTPAAEAASAWDALGGRTRSNANACLNVESEEIKGRRGCWHEPGGGESRLSLVEGRQKTAHPEPG